MKHLGKSVSFWLGKNRTLKSWLGRFLPSMGEMQVTGQFRLFFDLKDRTGPSFYVNYGGPAAFFHYEELEKSEILQALPADGVFIDIGANIGLFSLFIARYFPESAIYSFEPHPLLSACLENTVAANGLTHLKVVRRCVGDRTGATELFIHGYNSGGHSTLVDQIEEKARRNGISVEITTLDAFVTQQAPGRIDVIKVDVQGAEWQVLAGARQAIQSHFPTILIELDNRELAKAPLKLAQALGEAVAPRYSVRLPGQRTRSGVERIADVAAAELASGLLQSNYVLIPSER